MGYTDFTAPTFSVSSNGARYTIVSSETLWGNHPYVALKYTNGTYARVDASSAGVNTWTVTPGAGLEKIGVAANDLYGNPGVWLGFFLLCKTYRITRKHHTLQRIAESDLKLNTRSSN